MSQHFLGEIQWSEINPTFPQKKLKFIVNVVKRKNRNPNPIVLSVTQNGIVSKDIVSGAGQQSSDYTKYQTVEMGDFVMNHMDLLTGYVDISSYDGVTSPDYRVFQITDKALLPEYLLKLFQCLYHLKVFYGYGQGVSMYGRWRFVDINFQNFKIYKYIKMKGRKVYEFALKKVPDAIKSCIDEANLDIEEIKKVFIHQANMKMDEAIVKRLFKLYNKELPENILPMNIQSLGNSSVATIPTLFDQVLRNEIVDHKLYKNDTIIFASVGAGMNVNSVIYKI